MFTDPFWPSGKNRLCEDCTTNPNQKWFVWRDPISLETPSLDKTAVTVSIGTSEFKRAAGKVHSSCGG